VEKRNNGGLQTQGGGIGSSRWSSFHPTQVAVNGLKTEYSSAPVQLFSRLCHPFEIEIRRRLEYFRYSSIHKFYIEIPNNTTNYYIVGRGSCCRHGEYLLYD